MPRFIRIQLYTVSSLSSIELDDGEEIVGVSSDGVRASIVTARDVTILPTTRREIRGVVGSVDPSLCQRCGSEFHATDEHDASGYLNPPRPVDRATFTDWRPAGGA